MTDGAEPQRLWSHRETAEYLNISQTQLYVLNSKSEGPRSFKVGGLRRYDPADVRAWLAEHASDKETVR